MVFRRVFSAAQIAGAAALAWPAAAFEAGYIGAAQKPGIVLGQSAATPPPGLYMFNNILNNSGSLVGPGAPSRPAGGRTSVEIPGGALGLMWVPGWTLFGATYDATMFQPAMRIGLGAPIHTNPGGLHNTFIAPVGLSWKLGDSGFYLKAGLGIWLPTGTRGGANGLANIGAPWWTFQPNLVLSYVKDGWNFTANISQEINTANSITDYTSGNVLHAEFTATKTIGKWALGPVAYYVGQISKDRSSPFYGGAINLNRYDIWAAGAMVAYNFGPATLSVWATKELSARTSGGTPRYGVDSATVAKGTTVFATLSYRLWGP